ncbi:MAG: UDP-N-acetylmuramate dehydrogenase [Lachnospiraceae bacterium]|nr:UDP-N-acetylmuramate dehydrogenase [Lachnospiraceae bacterium]
MISEAVIEALKGFIPIENIYLQEPMKLHTTFRVGGPADCLIALENEEQLCKVQHYLTLVGIPFIVLGNGSNVLVSDTGYKGVVLQVGDKMNKVRVEGNCIVAQAGALLAQVANVAREHGLTGLEFASGIPGTVGGGVVMNAGAYGGEMSQVVTKVTVVNQEGEILELDNSTMEFGYRYSIIRNQPFVVTEVTFMLTQGDAKQIQAKMEDLTARRREKQPLEYGSAGSTFKRPEGYYAGELIMNAGLRGFQIGGAQVSEKHCGFVINTGGATAKDVMDVITQVKACVKDKFNVDLEPEVVFLGF